MKKNILIVGPNGSGRTTLAKLFANMLKKEEVVILCSTGEKPFENPFLFSKCTKETKLVIFDDFSISKLKMFDKIVSNPITVNKPNQEPFTINPKFVLTMHTYDEPKIIASQINNELYNIFYTSRPNL